MKNDLTLDVAVMRFKNAAARRAIAECEYNAAMMRRDTAQEVAGTAEKERQDAEAYLLMKNDHLLNAAQDEQYAEGFLKGSIDVLIQVIQRGD
jgi:hypothetical protein